MRMPIRQQKDVDKTQDAISKATGLDFTGTPELTRQEFKADTDTQTILKNFGVAATGMREVQYGGSFDYDIDLGTAMLAIDATKEAHRRLPAHLREKYPNWRDLLNAVEAGEIAVIDGNVTPTKEGKTDGSSDGAMAKAHQQSIPSGGPDGSSRPAQGPSGS